MASPLEIIIEASNGASDYGNKFGEPLICGFVRSFGMTDRMGVRREWIKPIMFSGGLGTMDSNMSQKISPEKGQEEYYMNNYCLHYIKSIIFSGMEVVKIGGPVYRIGVGGGSASSIEVILHALETHNGLILYYNQEFIGARR